MSAAGPDPIFLANLTPKEIREGEFDTAVLPVGATEYHGDHLPYCTDTLMAEELAVRFARELGTALVLPPIAYGMSLHLMAWPWTMSLRPQTLTDVVVDVGESLLAHGVTRLLVVSAHDGNPAPIEHAARELSDRHGMTVALFAGWQSLSRQLLAGTFDIDLDHGGQSEMSIVLHLRPDLAHPDRAVDLPNQRMDHVVRVFGPFDRVVPHGYSGQPSRGTAEEGAAILDAIAAHVGPFLRDLAANGWRNGSWMSGIGG
ncbi:MAG: creatinine amidohydrolase [Thermomicrobiales bacterium]|nr:creatinine amidohydrolase [Thermomicrobiales bacterium]